MPDLSVRTFATRAEGLRAGWAIANRREDLPSIIHTLRTALRSVPIVSRAVADALATLQSSSARGCPRSSHSRALAAMVRKESGLSLSHWRAANRVRLATCAIAHSDEQIAQIAYHVGYAVPPQLNRDFSPMLGTPPTAFRRAYRSLVAGCFSLGVVAVTGCSGGGSPVEPTSPGQAITVKGEIRDRLSSVPITGSTITFEGPASASANVTGRGTYELSGLTAGVYTVKIDGPTHVPHETRNLALSESTDVPFTVVKWGPTSLGSMYDATFQKFFHQVARVGRGSGALRKWVIPPAELYLVEGTIPREQFETVSTELRRFNEEALPALWCNWVGPLRITIGPDSPAAVDGRIIVRPNWDEGASGSLGDVEIRSGRVAINVFGPGFNRLLRPDEIRGILAHELFHVAGAFHVCGGNLGENPFGFSPTNCSYSASLMANLGPLMSSPSPEDRLASCLIYNRDTVPGNLFPDINPSYARR